MKANSTEIKPKISEAERKATAALLGRLRSGKLTASEKVRFAKYRKEAEAERKEFERTGVYVLKSDF